MGCRNSKVEDEERVSTCRKQKNFVKQAVKSRTVFAAAQAEYFQALRNIGGAFWQFAEVEFREQNRSSAAPPPSPPGAPPEPPLPPSPPPAPLPRPPSSDVPATPVAAEIPKTVSLPPLAQKNIPFPSEKVVISAPLALFSPPTSPKKKQEDADHQRYQDYLYNDSPPVYLYNNTYPPSPQPAFHPGSPPPPPPSEIGWDWFDLFQPPIPIHLIERRRSEHTTAVQIMEDEVPEKSARLDAPVQEAKQEPLVIIEQQNQKTDDKGQEQGEQLDLKKEEKLMRQQEQKTEDLKEELTEKKKETPEKQVEELPEEKKEAEKNILTVMVPPKGMDPLDVFREIDELFLMASESGKDVSRLLEAGKVHYNSNVMESRGPSDHSSRLLRGLSLGSRSPRTPLSWNGTETSEDSISEEGGVFPSHASTLGRLYAWEKKLYQEAKALESISFELGKKRKLLFNLDMKGANHERIEKTRATIKTLELQMMVSHEAMEATSSAIKKVTDEEVYPQLLELLDGLTHMWTETYECYKKQMLFFSTIKIPENRALESTSKSHKDATVQLEAALRNWQTSFKNVISTQKDYIHNVYKWLWVSLFKTESDSKTVGMKVTSMYNLCQEWQAALDRLPERNVGDAVQNFANAIRDVNRKQEDELRIHKKCDILARDLHKKIASLRDAEKKFASQNSGDEVTGEAVKVIFFERRQSVEALKLTVETEKEKFTKAMNQTRNLTMKSLKVSMPDLLQAISDFAKVCMQTYQDLHGHVEN
ncbi:hypothetical protein O6H91_04G135700 [Diphasiastrum complanatum]|uniref:Uncharacterized protein n=3 Tax=Diphasiastrum complanatum TaxID=34168 RepID=A0ACC2E218_DIPCM|nr:hypothetical protein O6H91_04G135400 [Diphasiastrum complanatum]KAJ7560565.1 hypothetical protein O6H91_04G135400 [Diphasiastrum complanatum]KAJ7560570.1 hypothetical protein O6H91_04G135700 [Diphasiastrum complanatum]